ncbi:hypothetical protein COOONC_17058 [Cooperia oncophora]
MRKVVHSATADVANKHEIVALKRLKIEKEREGFPITALREINMLLKPEQHEYCKCTRDID